MDTMSIADVKALTGGTEEGFMGGGMWIFFLFILLLFRGGAGFGGEAAGQISNDFMYSNLNNTLGQGFTQVANQNFTLQKDLAQGNFALQQGINQGFNQVGRDLAACCCETNRNIDAIRYENAKNTCDIITTNNMNTRDLIAAGVANTQRLADLFNDNKIQELRDKLQTSELTISQYMQTNNILQALKNSPIPSYPVAGNTPWPYPCPSTSGATGTGA